MTKYEKPMMTVLSLTGNEQLCGSCRDNNASILLVNDQTGLADQLDWLAGNGDGTLTRSEAMAMFGSGDECSRVVDAYCKYTGATTVAWS